ncbi:hypothetical protein ACFE04_031248 [Oxalis oulophora]
MPCCVRRPATVWPRCCVVGRQPPGAATFARGVMSGRDGGSPDRWRAKRKDERLQYQAHIRGLNPLCRVKNGLAFCLPFPIKATKGNINHRFSSLLASLFLTGAFIEAFKVAILKPGLPENFALQTVHDFIKPQLRPVCGLRFGNETEARIFAKVHGWELLRANFRIPRRIVWGNLHLHIAHLVVDFMTTAGVRVFKWNQALPEDVLPRGNELSRASAKKIVIVADIIVSPNSPTQATWILNRSRDVASLTDFLNIDLFYGGGEGDYSETCGLVLIPSLRELKRVRTEEFKSDKNKECAICLEELSSLRDRSTCRKMTCSHVFHGDCVGRWFWENPSCPLCRFPLPERFCCSAKRFQVNYLSTAPSQ